MREWSGLHLEKLALTHVWRREEAGTGVGQ